MSKSRLELGRTRRQKRRVLGVLGLVNLIALVMALTLFNLATQPATALRLMVGIVGVTAWLFSTVLLMINIAGYVLHQDDDSKGV